MVESSPKILASEKKSHRSPFSCVLTSCAGSYHEVFGPPCDKLPHLEPGLGRPHVAPNRDRLIQIAASSDCRVTAGNSESRGERSDGHSPLTTGDRRPTPLLVADVPRDYPRRREVVTVYGARSNCQPIRLPSFFFLVAVAAVVCQTGRTERTVWGRNRFLLGLLFFFFFSAVQLGMNWSCGSFFKTD